MRQDVKFPENDISFGAKFVEVQTLRGRDGKDGKDGYTPVKGVDYFDGVDGRNGVDGKDGYTPVKGVDYWTEEDTNGFKQYVEGQLHPIRQQIADMNYKKISIDSFTHNVGTKERGDTVAAVTLSWTLNKEPASLQLDGEALTAAKTGSRTISGLNITAANAGSVKWTLSAVDERGEVATKQSPGFTFLNCVYYGAAAQPGAIDSAFIKSLATKTSPTSTKTRTITVNGGGKYIWYCLPVGLGKCTFTNNGFPAGIELADTIAFTNALGYTENYYVYRSNQLITDSVTIGVG